MLARTRVAWLSLGILFSSVSLAQDIIVGIDLSAPARTPEEAVAAALEELCPKLAVDTNLSADAQQLLSACNAVLPAATSERAGAYRDLSARSATSETSLTVRGPSAVPLSTIGKHLSALRHSMLGRVASLDFAPLMLADSQQIASDVPVTSTLFSQRMSGYVSAALTKMEQAETTTEAGFEGNSRAALLGLDYRHNTNLFLGVASRFNHSRSDLQDGAGKIDGNDLNGTLYATYYQAANWYLEGALQFSKGDFDLTREIDFSASGIPFRSTATSNSSGKQRGYSVGGGYHYAFDNGVSSLFTATWRSLTMDVDQYSEERAGGFNLVVDAQSIKSSAANFSAHFSRAWSTRWAVVIPQLSLSYTHEFTTDGEPLVARFSADPAATPFVFVTEQRDSNYLTVNLGVRLVHSHGLVSYAQYETLQLMNSYNQSALSVGVRREF